MNSRERFYATVERKPVDRPACWLGDPTPEAVPALCEYYHVDNIKELKKVCGDDFYAVEIPYKSPTCSAIFAAFDWYMNGSDIDTEHRTLTAEGCFAHCEDIEDIEDVNFEWPDPALYIDPEECRRLVDEAPDDKVVMGMLWACHFQDTCAAFGMENCLMNMISDPEMVHYVDDRIVDFYVKALKSVKDAGVTVKACSHITGGGFYENIPRMLPEGMRAVVKKDSYEVPAIFKLLAKEGDIAEEMMYNTFNMGLGMVVAVDKEDVDKTMEAIKAAGDTPYIVGHMEAGEKGVTLC